MPRVIQLGEVSQSKVSGKTLRDILMNINLKSVFLTAKYIIPGMITRKKGCFINIGSISGLAAEYGFSVCNATKAAVFN
jgi:NADP-dependent 3-hydroxy acid dehydrogenase YdfG